MDSASSNFMKVNAQLRSVIVFTYSQIFLISNFRRVVNVVFFLLGDSSASEFYVQTFRNTLFRLHRSCGQEE